MDQWDVYFYDFPHPIGSHPIVIISPSEQAQNADIQEVNVLKVNTLREARSPKKLEVALDEADSLDHLSVARVHPIYLVLKENLHDRLGSVSRSRTKALIQKILEAYRFY